MVSSVFLPESTPLVIQQSPLLYSANSLFICVFFYLFIDFIVIANTFFFSNRSLGTSFHGFRILFPFLWFRDSVIPFPDSGFRIPYFGAAVCFYCKCSTAALINLFSSVINDSSAGKLSSVPSSTKSYLSLVSFFVHWKSIFFLDFLPTFKQFGVNSIYEYASTTRLKSKTFSLQYLGQKSSKLSPNLLFESLFHWVFFAILGCGNIFDQRLLSDHTLICIWPLELSEHYEPGNHTKNQRLKPLRNSLNVSRAKFDVRDFWTCRWRPSLLFKFLKKCVVRGHVCCPLIHDPSSFILSHVWVTNVNFEAWLHIFQWL